MNTTARQHLSLAHAAEETARRYRRASYLWAALGFTLIVLGNIAHPDLLAYAMAAAGLLACGGSIRAFRIEEKWLHRADAAYAKTVGSPS